MTLSALPLELAQLITAYLTFEDVVVLIGCGDAPAETNGLHQFLPSANVLDACVPNSLLCLRSERRRQTKRNPLRHKGRPCPSGSQSCLDRSACVYHNGSLRSLLLRNSDYASIAQTKLNATEALDHVGVDNSQCQSIAIEILNTQKQRRQLNYFAVAQTFRVALQRSLHDVVEWILRHVPLAQVPLRVRADVMLASCKYDEPAIGRRVLNQVLDLGPPSAMGLQRLLAAAARHGRVDSVRMLLHKLKSLGLVTVEVLQDALAAAAEGGHCDILSAIIDTANAKAFVLDATDALAFACRNSHRDTVQLIMRASPLVRLASSTPGCPTTPLTAAVEGGDSDIVGAILADPRVNAWDLFALQCAARDGKLAIVKLLLMHQQCRSHDVDVALRSVGRSPGQSRVVVHELVRHHTGLQLDAWELLDIVCSHGDTELIENVLSTVVGDSMDRQYWRPLVTAARHGHTKVVHRILQEVGVWCQLAVEHSLDSNAELAEALLAACHCGHLSTAQSLIALVPLDMIQLLRIVEAAAAAPSPSVLHWLLSSHNAIVSHCDLDAALQYACAHGRIDAARLLLKHHHVSFADGLPIQFAATSGAADLVALLLADPRVTEHYDLEAALVDAAREGHTAVVAILLADARVDITGGGAFHEAADRGHLDVIRLLMEAPVMWRNPERLDLPVAFARAAHHGHYAIVLLLLHDMRVPLPRQGHVTRIADLPKRAGDSMWCTFLQRFFRHPRIDPTANGNQLLVDACLHAKRGVVDALLRSGRVTVDPTALDTVNELLGLRSSRLPPYLVRRYALLADDLRRHLKRSRLASNLTPHDGSSP